MPRTRQRRGAAVAVALVLALAAGVALYAGLRHNAPFLRNIGTGCQARARGQDYPLAASQAAIAATIAGVAQRRALPGRAVTVAYATALQESKLQNLSDGDRDSVGVFQQRPSQGWGPARLLEQPVYATTKFFAALVTVPRYRHIPVYQAAQAVQRSADGAAYAQYQYTAAVLARAFTGRAAHGVWCWYGSGVSGPARLRAAIGELRKTFGPVPATVAADPVLTISAQRARYSWAEAAWLVTHAPAYGIRLVRYGGRQWSATRGADGWVRVRPRRESKPPPGTVVLG
ncbi:MAG: hypothetical protein ACLP7J_07535 [Streptosporangiaceae bacterium]